MDVYLEGYAHHSPPPSHPLTHLANQMTRKAIKNNLKIHRPTPNYLTISSHPSTNFFLLNILHSLFCLLLLLLFLIGGVLLVRLWLRKTIGGITIAPNCRLATTFHHSATIACILPPLNPPSRPYSAAARYSAKI